MEMRGKGKKKKKSEGVEMMMLGDRHLLLPEDVIVFKILVRLPVVDVIRCTSVCKQWCSLIKTPHFISTHLSFSSSSRPSIFANHYSYIHGGRVLSSHFDPKSFNGYRIIPFPFPIPHFFINLGPINGLFYLSNGVARGPGSEQFYCFWNPSVRRYIPIPSPTFPFNDSANIVRGFGFVDKNEDYKVVILAYLRKGKYGFKDTPNCQLFSLKQGGWRTLGIGEEAKHSVAEGNGLFVNGSLHWVARTYRHGDRFCGFVLAFDCAQETFRKIEFPQEGLLHASQMYSILDIKGFLACFDFDDGCGNPESGVINYFSIWVMKEYGVANSWVKMWTFELMGSTLSWVYGFWGNADDILVEIKGYSCEKNLFLYDTKTQGSKDFGGDAELSISNICTYTESLLFFEKESGAVSYGEPTPDANPLSGSVPLLHAYLTAFRWLFSIYTSDSCFTNCIGILFLMVVGNSMKRKRERNKGRQLIKSKRRSK